MRRISSNMSNRDLQYQMKRKDFKLNETQSKIGSGRRLNNLRDNPIAAAHSTRLSSSISELSRYNKNIDYAKGEYSLAETSMNQSLDVLQRLRELAVQGSNGTYGKDELNYMATEVNELLGELVSNANTRAADGRALFGGNDTTQDPFMVMKGRVPGLGAQGITGVKYTGNIVANQVEIAEGVVVDLNFKGNSIYWADDQALFAQRDVEDYVVKADSSFEIDGQSIPLKQGDNIHTIVSKINGADVAVKASLDPVTNSMTLQTTVPHQIWLDESEGQTTLKDLGLLSSRSGRPPENLHRDVAKGGGSLFDTVISFRDSLLKGDQKDVGGRVLGAIDSSLSNVLSNMADLGARSKRLDATSSQNESMALNYTKMNANLTDLDMTKAITDLKMVEYGQKAAYQSSAKILQSSLMDFLR